MDTSEPIIEEAEKNTNAASKMVQTLEDLSVKLSKEVTEEKEVDVST